jgi:DUF1365 family protein
MNANMNELESISQSFIIKVWIEEHPDTDSPGTWRGYITEVLSGERRYLKDLDEIPDFIAPRLENMGVKFGIRWRVRRWFKRVRKRGKR